jgi:steroid delta-isomerase-like uncharacterized protein
MSEQNKALAERWMNDSWNTRDPNVVHAAVEALMDTDAVAYMEGVTIRSPQDFLNVRSELIKGFPDIAMEIHERVGERDVVALRWRVTGTHQGTYLGIPATGRRIEVTGSTWFYFQDGRHILGYDTWNQGALLNQLRGSRPARAARRKRKARPRVGLRAARKSAARSAARPARKQTSSTRSRPARKQRSRSRPK